jgi:hypothetical protein
MSAVPQDLPPPMSAAASGADEYMAHNDAMHQAAISEQFNAIPGPKGAPGQPPQAQAPQGAAPGASVPPAPSAAPAPSQASTREAFNAIPEEKPSAAVSAEMERLQQGTGVKERLQAQYGEGLPEVLRSQAETNLGIVPRETPPAAPAKPDVSFWDTLQRSIVPGGEFTIEQPRTLYKGIRDAYQGVIDTVKLAGDYTNKIFPAIQLTGEGAPRIVSAAERAANPDLPGSLADNWHLPDIENPHTMAGVAEKNVIQFITGMNVAGGQLKALGLPAEAAGWAGRGISALKGFMSMAEAFETPKADLSNLVQSVPALSNPVNEMLSIKGDDSAVVARLKAAAEGTIGAQAVDGLVGGIRFLRGALNAKAAAEAVPELDAANTAAGEAAATEANAKASAGMTALGDVNEPLVGAKFARPESKLAAQEGAAAGIAPEELKKMGEVTEQSEAAPGTGTKINFARIASSDDIKNVMQELVNRQSGDIEQARRGIQTWADTKLGADSINAWDQVMSRRTGEIWNDQQTLAARELWTTSAAKLREVNDIAMSPGGATLENLTAYYKMLTTHLAIEQELMGARAEWGRAGGAWKILAAPQGFRMGDLAKAVMGPKQADIAGVPMDVMLDMAKRTKAIFDGNEMTHLGDFIEKSAYAKTRDAVLEFWTNGLLTATGTPARVIASNSATIAQRMAERYTAEKIGQIIGSQDGVAAGETAAQYAGLVGGIKDSLRYAGRAANAFLNEQPIPTGSGSPLELAIKAAKTGHYSANEEGYVQDQYVNQGQFPGAISSQALGIQSTGWLGQGLDLLSGLMRRGYNAQADLLPESLKMGGNASETVTPGSTGKAIVDTAGEITRAPSHLLTGVHDFYRSIAYRMAEQARAVRQATSELNAGNITQEAFGGRVQELLANPSPSIRIGSANEMLYQTFTDAPGKLADVIDQLRTNFPMTRVIIPFYKIPARIMSFTFERTPIAPLMASYQANVAAGGARAALARAQMGLGTAVMLASADAWMSGQITGSGPASKSARDSMSNQGWLPYSKNMGTADKPRWVQFNRVETIGSTMGMVADICQALHDYHDAVNKAGPDSDMELEKIPVAAALAVASDVTSKLYLKGLSDFFDTLANPKAEGERQAQELVGSFVPAGVAEAARMNDPYRRAVYSMLDAVKARTPGASKDLPPYQNKWGEPVKSGSDLGRAYDAFSPFATREPTDSPIDKEILRLGMTANRPAASQSFGAGAVIDLSHDPKMYARFMELAGNGYKDPSMGDLGAKDALSELVSGKGPLSAVYEQQSDGPQGGKAQMIQGIMNSYRAAARDQLLDEYPKLQQQVEEKRAALQAARMPTQ